MWVLTIWSGPQTRNVNTLPTGPPHQPGFQYFKPFFSRTLPLHPPCHSLSLSGHHCSFIWIIRLAWVHPAHWSHITSITPSQSSEVFWILNDKTQLSKSLCGKASAYIILVHVLRCHLQVPLPSSTELPLHCPHGFSPTGYLTSLLGAFLLCPVKQISGHTAGFSRFCLGPSAPTLISCLWDNVDQLFSVSLK